MSYIITNQDGLTGTNESIYGGVTNLLIGNNFTISNPLKYITIYNNNVTIDGQFNTLTVSTPNYPGLVGNTGPSVNVTIKNLNIVTCGNPSLELGYTGGWVCQSNFTNGTITNCSSNGIISNNGGGIVGPSSTNCTTTYCYSNGSIGSSGGGIYGFGCTGCTANYCYSTGSIGSYGGGIFGSGCTGCVATNTYSVGNGSTLSGGIFGSGCTGSTANFCYTAGATLSNDGIFATYNSTNKIYCSFSELYNSCDKIPVWKDKNAKKILRGLGCIWIDINKCSSHVPWLLKTLNKQLYWPNCQKIKCSYATSNNGLVNTNCNTWDIIRVNGDKPPHSININSSSGQLVFNKVKKGKYQIKIINGAKVNLPSNYVGFCGYYTYSAYNINNYFLKSKYKCHKKKKCNKSSSSSSSYSSSSSSSTSSRHCCRY